MMVMIMKRLDIASLFRMRRVNRVLKQEAEKLLAKRKRLILCVMCNKTQKAILNSEHHANMSLLLPGSTMTQYLPAVRKLLGKST